MRLKGQIVSINHLIDEGKTEFKFFGNDTISAFMNDYCWAKPATVIDAEVIEAESGRYKIVQADFYDVSGPPGNITLIPIVDLAYREIQLGVSDFRKVIEDVKSIELDLMAYLKRNPSDMRILKPETFEKLICELLNKSGFEATWSGRDRKTSADVLAYQSIPILGIRNKFLVECKRYSEDRPVGLEIVRSAYGALHAESATGSILVTTSRFESGVVSFVNGKWNMNLIDYESLKSWIGRVVHW